MKGFVGILLTTMFLSRYMSMSTSASTRMRMSSSLLRQAVAFQSTTPISTTTRSTIPTSSSWSSSCSCRCSSRQPSRLFTASTTAVVIDNDNDKPAVPRKFVPKPFEVRTKQYHPFLVVLLHSSSTSTRNMLSSMLSSTLSMSIPRFFFSWTCTHLSLLLLLSLLL